MDRPGTIMNGESLGNEDTTCQERCLVGNIEAAVHTLRSQYGNAFHEAKQAFRFTDLQVLLAFAFLPHIIFRFVNYVVNKTIRRTKPLDFEKTFLSKIATRLGQVGQLGLVVYFGELFMVFLSGLGVPHLKDKPRLLASFVCSFYVAKTMSDVSNHFVHRACLRGEICSQVTLLNRLLDSIIYIVTTLLFLDANNVDLGMAVNYLLTLGSVSSIVVGMALKDPLMEIVQGTNLLLSNKFSPGDVIRLSDGTCGKVTSFQWTDVIMQGDDNSLVRIPHSKLATTRIINMSRMECSQVFQKVSLTNRGPTKIEALLGDIKGEIRETCPKLIDDGSQPFRVNWTDIDGDKVVVSIESHYDIPRLGDEYWENRQAVLMAINRAVLKYNGET